MCQKRRESLCIDQVNDVIPMGTMITLSTDWGEALEKHRLRGQGKGNVLRVIDPQDGFVERWAVGVSCVHP